MWARGEGIRATSSGSARGPQPCWRLVGQSPVAVQDGLGVAGRARGEQDHSDIGAAGGAAGQRPAAEQRVEPGVPSRTPITRRAPVGVGQRHARPRPGPVGSSSSRMRATSAGPTWWWIGVATAPQRQQAWKRTTASHQLGSCQATTSRWRTPRDRRPPGHRRGQGVERGVVEHDVPVDDRRSRARQGRSTSSRSRPGTSQAPPGRRWPGAPGWGKLARSLTGSPHRSGARTPVGPARCTGAPTDLPSASAPRSPTTRARSGRRPAGSPPL